MTRYERRIIAAIILLDLAGYLTAKKFFLASQTSFWSNNDLTIGVHLFCEPILFLVADIFCLVDKAKYKKHTVCSL
jgi:hypothetical protein